MKEDVYKRLAVKLDAIPNGFPSTESGVELQLLARIFTPEEAAVASIMNARMETADAIAERVGMEPRDTLRMLKEMTRKGLIRLKRKDRQFVFGLMPFIVGFYEEQLPRMDEELAALVEAYLKESHTNFYGEGPSVHRVIPVDKAIDFELEVFPFERASQLVEDAKAWGVRDCICRKQQRLIGKGCQHEIENCLMIAPVEGVFGRSTITKPISKEEALHILKASEEVGLVHCTANHREGIYYICNCCTCCCGVLRGLTEFEIPAAVTTSDFRNVVDEAMCTGCGVCIDHCVFNALDVSGDACVVAEARCVGCGLCISSCPEEALRLIRRSGKEAVPLADDIKDWMETRAEKRGISTEDIL